MPNTTTLSRDPADSWAASGRGVGGLVQAYMLGPQIRQQAEMATAGKLAQTYAHNMQGNKFGAEADDQRFTTDQRRGVDSQIAADPAMQPYMQNLLRVFKMTGDTNAERVAKAGTEFQAQGLRDRAAAEPNVEAMNRIISVVSGKAYEPFANVGNTGYSLNKATGSQAEANPVIAKLFQLGENAQINQRNAAAGASSASAANSYASAAQHRVQTQKVNQDISMGSKGVLQQTDQGLMLVDPRTGTARPVLGGDGAPVAGKSKDLNEGQAKANLFGNRMRESVGILNGLEDRGFKTPSLIKQGMGGIPLIGGAMELLANKTVASGEQQQVEQAQRDFVNAVLRRESGAAIATSEFANATKQYFPQPGDGKEVLAQKRKNRELATTLMLSEVPQAHRYKPNSGGASGQWGETATPAATGGWSIQRVE